MYELLIAVASLLKRMALGTRISIAATHRLRGCGSWALEHNLSSWALGLSCSAACGIFPNQGLNLSLALAGRFFTTEPPRRPLC